MNTTLNPNRSINLFIVAGIAITLVVVASFVIMSVIAPDTSAAPNIPQEATGNKVNAAFEPPSANAFPQYRQSEWHPDTIPATGLNGQEVYFLSERTLIPPQAGLEAYHLSERTLTDPNAGLAIYQLSERTLVDPQAGLATYFESERTSIPVQFTPYQISEWFGK